MLNLILICLITTAMVPALLTSNWRLATKRKPLSLFLKYIKREVLMLTIIILIGISILIPYFWFVTIAYVIYLIATKKQRRNKIILNEIMQSIDLKREQVLLDYFYFASAKSFAVDHGATLSNDPSDDTLIVDLNIGGADYQVTLQRSLQDETLLSVCRAEKTKAKQKSILAEDPLLLKDSA